MARAVNTRWELRDAFGSLRVSRALAALAVLVTTSCGGGSAAAPLKLATPVASSSAPPVKSAAPLVAFGLAPSASASQAPLTPKPAKPPRPPEVRELIGDKGRTYGSGGVRQLGTGSEPDLYDRLFPKRLSLAACRAQHDPLSAEQALARGFVLPRVYSETYGQFSAPRRQQLVRFSIRYCTPQLIDEEHQVLAVVEDGRPSLEFTVPAALQLYALTDLEWDGSNELIVDSIRGSNPQTDPVTRSILGFAGGKLHELFRGKYAAQDCSAGHPSYDAVSITVVRQGTAMHFDETLWRQSCDSRHPHSDIGPSVLVEHTESTVEPVGVASDEPNASAVLASQPYADPSQHDRKPAATALQAACRGSSNDCQCPNFSGMPEGRGRAALLRQGSFSGPYPEALVEVMLCEAHSNNFGGTALVRKVDGGWVPTGYVAGFVPRSCSSHRGADGLERLACFESYGLNQGTYTTSASVVDFAAKTYDVLSEAECEEARDVKGMRWHSSTPSDLSVELVVEAGLRRDNAGFACLTVGGSARLLRLRYDARDAGYVPTAQAEGLLPKLLPKSDPDFAVTPSVAAAMLPSAAPVTSWPAGLRPQRRSLELDLPSN